MSLDFNLSLLRKEVAKANNALLLTHYDPDGDALGAVLALREILREENTLLDIALSGKLESGLEFLRIPKEHFKRVDVSEYDLIIIVDTNNPYRTGMDLPDNISNLPPTFIIDHHIYKGKNGYPDNIKSMIVPHKTATCEIIFDLLKEEKIDYSMNTAFFLLIGIYTDSGGFFHSNTTPNLLKKVKEILKKGVPLRSITQSTHKRKSVETLNFWGDKIAKSNFNPKLKFLSTFLNNDEISEKNISTEELGGLANLLNMCREANFSLFLREEDDKKIKGSLRSSAHKNTDVSVVARFLEGGGHKLASGFELEGKIVDKGKNSKAKTVEN